MPVFPIAAAPVTQLFEWPGSCCTRMTRQPPRRAACKGHHDADEPRNTPGFLVGPDRRDGPCSPTAEASVSRTEQCGAGGTTLRSSAVRVRISPSACADHARQSRRVNPRGRGHGLLNRWDASVVSVGRVHCSPLDQVGRGILVGPTTLEKSAPARRGERSIRSPTACDRDRAAGDPGRVGTRAGPLRSKRSSRR